MDLPVGNRVMSPEEAAKVAQDWDLSEEKKKIDLKQKRLKQSIEVLQVGSYSPMDRLRVLPGQMSEEEEG